MLSSLFTDVLTIAWHTYPAGTVGVFHDDSYIGYSYGSSPDNDWIARDDYVLYVDLDGSLGDVYDVERSYGALALRALNIVMPHITFILVVRWFIMPGAQKIPTVNRIASLSGH